jgi:hypothetical protein
VDPRKTWRSLLGLPRYLRDLRRFRSAYRGRLDLTPCLHDWYAEAGTTSNEYFWQDLLVARMVFAARPRKHVDVGSRVDGFVAHVASFREIEVFDVRPISATIPGVVFKQADLMQNVDGSAGYCDSLSCLHALEHFGLGRYGDPVDPDGYRYGLTNMVRILEPGGTLYLAVPVGRPRVAFNANRVFDPAQLVSLAQSLGLQLKDFHWHTETQGMRCMEPTASNFAHIAGLPYGLGLFVLVKSD